MTPCINFTPTSWLLVIQHHHCPSNTSGSGGGGGGYVRLLLLVITCNKLFLPELHLEMFRFVPGPQVALLQALVKRILHPARIGQKWWPVPLVRGSMVRTGKSGRVSAEAVVDTFEIFKQTILNQLSTFCNYRYFYSANTVTVVTQKKLNIVKTCIEPLTIGSKQGEISLFC